jgi:hypothetical protein
MPRFIGEGIHKVLGGHEEESWLDLQRHRVLPPSGLGAQLPNGLFVDGMEKDGDETFSDMFISLFEIDVISFRF